MSELTPAGIDAVCGLVDELCGICWDESKAYLIEARLHNLVEQTDSASYEELVRKVRAEVAPDLKEQVVDAVTTNETLWFRDTSPFDALRYKVIPEFIDEKAGTAFSNRLRVWSAACSTGQEPYSIAMAIVDTIPDVDSWDIQILGTDVSAAAIEPASRGEYDRFEIARGMDAEHLQKHFVEQDGRWKIHDRIRAMCSFQQRNLLDPFTDLGPFDVIFCRNVAIYFSEEEQRRLFDKLANVLTPGGWVFVGSSESPGNVGPNWQAQHHCRSNCYRPNLVAT